MSMKPLQKFVIGCIASSDSFREVYNRWVEEYRAPIITEEFPSHVNGSSLVTIMEHVARDDVTSDSSSLFLESRVDVVTINRQRGGVQDVFKGI